MKYLLVIIIALTTTTYTWSQTTAPDSVKNKEKIKAARVAFITERLSLTSQEAEKFWPLYNAYTDKRHALKKSQHVLNKTENNEDIIDASLEIEQKKLDLEKDFYKQARQVLPVAKLNKLRDAEADFKKIVLREIHNRKQGAAHSRSKPHR